MAIISRAPPPPSAYISWSGTIQELGRQHFCFRMDIFYCFFKLHAFLKKLYLGSHIFISFLLHLFLLYSYFPHDPFLTLFFLFFICFRCLYFFMFCSTGLTEMKLTPIFYLVVNGVYNELTCMKQLTEAKLWNASDTLWKMSSFAPVHFALCLSRGVRTMTFNPKFSLW